MNEIKVLLSAFNHKNTLISHFCIMSCPIQEGPVLRAKIYDVFKAYMRNRQQYTECRFMFIIPDKLNIEYTDFNGDYMPMNLKFLTPIYYASSPGVINNKTIPVYYE